MLQTIKVKVPCVEERKGSGQIPLHNSGIIIPTLSEKPVNSLGKLFDCSLKNSDTIHKTCGDLEAWLTKTDMSGLPGRFKAWVFQHARVLWPLLLYEVLMSTVEALEKIGSYLWWWLGLPRSLSSDALYGSNSLQLPLSSLSEEFVMTRSREAMQYRDSRDSKVAAAGIEVRPGRKWSAARELQVAESQVNFLKAREKPLSQPSTRASCLSTAPDWQLRVELGSQLKFSSHIVETRLRPELVICSDSTKQVIMWS